MSMRFSFCGNFGLIKDKPLVEEGTSRNGKPYAKIKFGVNSGSDRAYVEAFAGVQDEIKITDRQGNKLDIAWEDRLNPDIVSNSTRVYVCNFGERKTFLSQYDQISYLSTVLAWYKGKIIVTGYMNKSYYEGKWYDNYTIQNVYAANDADKPRLLVSGNIIFNRDSLDNSAYKSSGIMTVTGYTEQYMDKDHPNALVPQTCVLNISKLNREDPAQDKAVKLRETFLIPKSKGWTHSSWEFILKNGQEEIEFDESQLTDLQKLALETGQYTLDDFKPTKRIYGEKITQLRMYRPMLRDEFVGGPVPYGDDATVEALIYRPGVVKSVETVDDGILGLGSSDVDDLFA